MARGGKRKRVRAFEWVSLRTHPESNPVYRCGGALRLTLSAALPMKRFSLLVVSLALLAPGLRADPFAFYGITGAGSDPSILYQLDPNNGAILSTVGNTGLTHVTAMSFNPLDGKLYVASSGTDASLYTINTSTGAATLIGALGGADNIPDMTFRSDGTLFAWSENNDTLKTINVSTGVATDMGFGTGTSQTGLEFGPNGVLYLKPGSDFYTVDAAHATVAYSMTTGVSLQNLLAIDSAGRVYSGVRDSSSTLLYTIDLQTTQALLIGTAGAKLSAIAFTGTAPAIPEPSTYAMMFGAAALGLALWRRRRIA